MNILYVTFSPLNKNSGHTARLKYTLKKLSKDNKVHIMCLRSGRDKIFTRLNFPGVKFSSLDASFDRWSVQNSSEISKNIYRYCRDNNIDLVVVLMEVWDIVRDLSCKLEGKVPMSVVFNSIPFVMSPNKPSGNFDDDVDSLLKSDIPDYKKIYISEHRNEMSNVMSKIQIISPNKTVSKYLKLYFPNKIFFELPNMFLAKNYKNLNKKECFKYDLAYMARMEIGKGVEYLCDISESLHSLIGRKINLVIIGRADDDYSRNEINKLLTLGSNSEFVNVEFTGWLNDSDKQKYLSKSNIFVYPSIFDTYAVVINEAVSLGLPVVTWDSFFYQNNYKEMDFIIPANLLDVKDFANKVSDAMHNRKKLSNIISIFNKKICSSNYDLSEEIGIYKNIINYEKN